MAFTGYLTWGAIILIIGGSVGVAASKLANVYSKRQEVKKMLDVLEEKTPNNLKLDGETINVNKFAYKRSDGEVIKVEIADIVKKAKIKGSKQEKLSFMRRILKKVFSFKTK